MAEKKKHAGEWFWSISLDVECPYCGAHFDASDTQDFNEEIADVQICQGKKNVTVFCFECEQRFQFDIGDGQ